MKCIDIFCYQIEAERGSIIICPCHDAALFSDDALRMLLLSEKTEQITASVAISVENGKITLKLARL